MKRRKHFTELAMTKRQGHKPSLTISLARGNGPAIPRIQRILIMPGALAQYDLQFHKGTLTTIAATPLPSRMRVPATFG
jgi:hypothetical protein